MHNFNLIFLYLLLGLGVVCGQDRGQWVGYNMGRDYAPDYRQAVGGNCLIYYPSVDADTVLVFDTYSHQWHEHPFILSQLSSKVFAGENAAMAWNDSVLVLFDAIHSTFHDLKFDGDLIYTGNAPYNLPGSIGRLSYIITTEKIYIFDHDSEEWSAYAYTHPGTGGSFAYSGHGKKDYIMISISNNQTSETKTIAFSRSRKVFEEISSVNLQFNIMDHGFACWVNAGVPESDFLFTVYSVENGFMETVRPNRYFDTFINWNDPVAESTVFMASYYIPPESSGFGTRYIYAADTRQSSFNSYSYADSYGAYGGVTLSRMVVGFATGLIVNISPETLQSFGTYYDGKSNSFHDVGALGIQYDLIDYSFYSGATFFTGNNQDKFVFYNISTQQLHNIELPARADGYTNPTTLRINSNWGAATCQRALSDTIRLFSLNTVTNTVQEKIDIANSYDFDKLNKLYYYYVFQAYNDAKKILVYEPNSDLWTTLPLAPDANWVFGSDFVCTYDKNDGNMKIHDVPANRDMAFPLGWQYDYNYSKHTYGRDKFFIASNTEGHYYGFSSYTRDVKEFVSDYYNATTGKGMVAVLYNSWYERDFLTYNALSNSFIFLNLDDNQGDSRNIWIGDSTALITTMHGYLYAFDPYPEVDGMENSPKSGNLTPAHFCLQQNYPNPFNDQCVIKYQIGRQSTVPLKVVLSVYNLIGQKIITLVDDFQQPGTYAVPFNAAGLSSGIYFYKFEVSAPLKNSGPIFKQTRRLVLLK